MTGQEEEVEPFWLSALPPLCSNEMEYIQILEIIYFISYWQQICLILPFSCVYQVLIINKPPSEWSFSIVFMRNNLHFLMQKLQHLSSSIT